MSWHSQLYAGLLFILQTAAIVVTSQVDIYISWKFWQNSHRHASLSLFLQNLKLQFTIGLQLRTCLTSALYKKALVLAPEARQETTVGQVTFLLPFSSPCPQRSSSRVSEISMQVVNLMSSDVGQVVMLGQHINFLWSCPLQVQLEGVSML